MTLENVCFFGKPCKLGEFPLEMEVCHHVSSVGGGTEHMSVVITLLEFS